MCVKNLMKDLYHLETSLDQPMSAFAHEMHSQIDDDEVIRVTELDW